jgi:5-methylcytosine-specific restriction endonuclease McrA
MKAAVIQRDGGLCVLNLEGCTGEAQTTDHRANRQAGGSRILNDPTNLVGACVRCNDRKAKAHGGEREDLEQRGINVIPDSTHAKTLARAKKTAVQYPDGFWYWLIDEHTRERADGPTPF